MMKTILNSLTSDQAQKEMERFAKLGLPFSIVGLFAIGWIGGAGIMFGGRALLLTFHKGNRKHPHLLRYRTLSAFTFLLGCFDVIRFFSHT